MQQRDSGTARRVNRPPAERAMTRSIILAECRARGWAAIDSRRRKLISRLQRAEGAPRRRPHRRVAAAAVCMRIHRRHACYHQHHAPPTIPLDSRCALCYARLFRLERQPRPLYFSRYTFPSSFFSQSIYSDILETSHPYNCMKWL